MATTFDDLMASIDKAGKDVQRDRGNMFEDVVKSYLTNEPTYKREFDQVWLLREVPAEYKIPKKDLGVDLVARNRNTGELTAVQAKYYKGKVGKETINSYMAELNKNYYANGLLVATTDEWNRNAAATLEDTTKEVSRIGLSNLRHAAFDWSKFSFGDAGQAIQASNKQPRDYQKTAIAKTLDYFQDHERGKLIMAPGTGKTFTSLKIAEAMAKKSGQDDFKVLYLVPSIQLLSQTLFAWNTDVSPAVDLISFAITSDRNASKKRTFSNDDEGDLNISDIGLPATTDVHKLMKNYRQLRECDGNRITVIFSTYQSIDVIHQAQQQGFPKFDLIIADEAHRTVGSHASQDEAGMFTKVHSNGVVKASHRLYQTATPKLYSEAVKKQAKEDKIVVSSMDDVSIYGDEIYRLGFGEAVSSGILTDYKVEVLAVDQSVIQKDMQKSIADENGLGIGDIGKIIGVWNAMMRRESFSNKVSGAPMKRAIAFSSVINNQRGKNSAHKVGSMQIADKFNQVVNEYLGEDNPNSFNVEVKHVDGSMNALEKKDAIDWLAGDFPDDTARILSNVKFLTEGIDVPNLDAIIFFAPKKSQIDIVQAVGRIMRKFKNKDYGYIILPVVVPAGVKPESVLDDNKTYKTVWQVLNALRSIDERFEATINKLDLNKKRPSTGIDLIGVGGAPDDDLGGDSKNNNKEPRSVQTELELNWHEIQNAIFGRIVKKVGDRRYLDDWSSDVQKLAKNHVGWIENLISDRQSPFAKAFKKFVKSLQHNINSDITEHQAIEMLAQHIITKPVFEALFEQYSFVNDNPVSKAMETMIQLMLDAGFDKEQKELEPFYDSVKLRAQNIDNSAGKQEFIKTLYNNFFKKGFTDTADRLGVVFTPVEIVDFIVKSVDEALQKHFGKGLETKNVHILDPFTGTGTFITRTLQYLAEKMNEGEITLADITRKYTQELHANEIVLLSYYIAAINIEAVFDEINGPEKYVPFDGIVLADTFESTENENSFEEDMFGGNNDRLKKQQEVPITAIISNPPYSVGQTNQNDNNQNIHYPILENDIANTYVKESTSALSKGLYDSYIKAFRWSSNRLKGNGVIGFITNSSFIDKSAMDGFRKTILKEYNYVYVYNLRGAVKGKKGVSAKREGSNVFNILTGVAIAILVKDGSSNHHLYYKDIGEFLSLKQKFDSITKAGSISGLDWTEVIPDEKCDWINQRDGNFENFTSISSKTESSVFGVNAVGISTNRDAWVYGFGKKTVEQNLKQMIENYNSEVDKLSGQASDVKLKSLNGDGGFVKWTVNLKQALVKETKISFSGDNMRLSLYRPFTKKWLYYDDDLIERPGLYKTKFGSSNQVILTTGRGTRNEFSVFATDLIPNMDSLEKTQGFMKFNNQQREGVFLELDNNNISEYFANKLGLSAEDAYAYVYAVLNSPEYQSSFENNLIKDLARIPVLKHIDQYVSIGRKLLELHINYENAPIYDGVQIIYKSDRPSFKVEKSIRYKSSEDKTEIRFNSDITIKGIPERAEDYELSGRSAIGWILHEYQVSKDSKSGITDDPNEYSDDQKYIFNLLLRVITVSLNTLDLVAQLPKFEVAE